MEAGGAEETLETVHIPNTPIALTSNTGADRLVRLTLPYYSQSHELNTSPTFFCREFHKW